MTIKAKVRQTSLATVNQLAVSMFRKGKRWLGSTIFIVSLSFVFGTTAHADDVLIFGDRSSDLANLAVDLAALGHTVTNSATLPADLSSFDTIWHVGAFAPITAGEQSQLAAFLSSGRGLHLTGERPCCETLNASLQAFVNTVVVGGGVVVGGLGDVAGPYPFNGSAKGGIATTPNTLTNWNPSASGGMGGLGALPDANILATGDGNVPVAAVWSGSDLVGGRGALTLMMDVNWFSTADRVEVIENLQTFISTAGRVAPAPRAATPVPTLSEWGMIILSSLMALGTIVVLRRRNG
jgi:hypothetical protein